MHALLSQLAKPWEDNHSLEQTRLERPKSESDKCCAMNHGHNARLRHASALENSKPCDTSEFHRVKIYPRRTKKKTRNISVRKTSLKPPCSTAQRYAGVTSFDTQFGLEGRLINRTSKSNKGGRQTYSSQRAATCHNR